MAEWSKAAVLKFGCRHHDQSRHLPYLLEIARFLVLVSFGFEGVVSKTIDAPYAPGNRGLWRKAKARNCQEFVIGWSDPEGTRRHLGAFLLGCYTDGGKLTYAGRVGTGMSDKILADLRRRLEPLARVKSPLSVPPPHKTRFGSARSFALTLGRAEACRRGHLFDLDGRRPLRHTVYAGLREDKPATDVRQEAARLR
jgi:bifunctional non-homologous end joining protein LigD